VVAVLVVLLVGYLTWRSQPHPEPVPVASSSAPLPPAGPAVPTGSVVVAVHGRVVRPGTYRLPAGSRVGDAIDAAGGALPGVDLSYVNLARRLVDGELIVIGGTPPPDQAGTGTGTQPGGRIDLNTATLTQLETLPGVGPSLAQRIIDYRTQHGGFRSVDELRKVQGIGDTRFAQLKDLVTV
jgi:competence protein ComEA